MKTYDISIFTIPIFKSLSIKEEEVHGLRIVIFGIIPITITYGTESGDHVHFSLGLLKFELFGGLSLWKKWLP